jgi:uncharacterized repeat protein (TIGR02543 family)
MKKNWFLFPVILLVLAGMVIGCDDGGGGGGGGGGFTVTFNSQGGTAVASRTGVASGSTITAPAAPTREGFIFGGWFKDESCLNAWNFATDTVTSSIILYAKWTAFNPETQALVTFNLNYTDAPAPSQVVVNKNASLGTDFPAAPTRLPGAAVGYVFASWNTEADGEGDEFTSSTTVSANITVYAQWDEVSLTTPILDTLQGNSYELNTTEDVQMRIRLLNDPAITTLSYQWYKSATEDGDGTTTGTDSRDFTPPVNVVGVTWYWVVVTNTVTNESATSNRARIQIYSPSGDSDIEKIEVHNAAMPLWEFTLPEGASWGDYDTFSIQYYVSKDSRIVQSGVDVRSRAYGAYIDSDFIVPDQGNVNGWGGYGDTALATRIVSWNDNPMSTPGRDSLTGTGNSGGANPNNDFIIDNVRGTAGSFSSLFSSNGGGQSKWFTVTYSTDTGIAQEFAKVTKLDSKTVDVIYVGAGIFGPGGDAGTNAYEFYVKNPTLVNKSDPELNIPGNRNKTGTTEQLWAGNLGSPRDGTTREVVTEYEDVAGEIQITFDLNGGIGDFPPINIMQWESLGDKFPATEPTRKWFEFIGWFVGDEEVDEDYAFEDATTVTAKWEKESTWDKDPYEVDLSGQTLLKNDVKWDTTSVSPLVIDLGEDLVDEIGKYDILVFVCNFYDTDDALLMNEAGDAYILPDGAPSGDFGLRLFYVPDEGAAVQVGSTFWNFGSENAVIDQATGEVTITLTISNAMKAAANGPTEARFSPAKADATAQYIEIISITADFND